MTIFTPEILAMAEDVKLNKAEWGVDDDGLAFSDFNGERVTWPVPQVNNWELARVTNNACSTAHMLLEEKLGREIEYHFYGRNHPYSG